MPAAAPTPTAGCTATSSNSFLGAPRAHSATLISLDRQERGRGTLSAAQEVEREHATPVGRIIGLNDVLDYLRDDGDHDNDVRAIELYRQEYGV